jgi:hypothetical protein
MVDVLMLYFLFKSTWASLLPPLSSGGVQALNFYVNIYPASATPYELYKRTGLQLSSAYKTVRSLARRRFLSLDGRGYVATAKAALALYYASGDVYALRSLKKMWDIEVRDEALLAYLVVLGSALKKLGLDVTAAYICKPTSAAMYINEFIRGSYKSLHHVLGVPEEVLKESYETHVKILEGFMARYNRISVLLRMRGRAVDILAVRCPNYGVCGHPFPEECPEVKKLIEEVANASAES